MEAALSLPEIKFGRIDSADLSLAKIPYARRRDCPDFHLRVSILYASYYDESR